MRYGVDMARLVGLHGLVGVIIVEKSGGTGDQVWGTRAWDHSPAALEADAMTLIACEVAKCGDRQDIF